MIKSNNLALDPRQATYSPGSTGTRESSRLFELRNTGESSLTVTDIFLEADGPEGRARIEGCDFEAEGIPDTTLLLPDVLPTCSMILRDRPDMPSDIEPGQFRQIEVVYRPIDGLTDPTGVRLVIESNATNERTAFSELEITRGFPDISGNQNVIQFPSTGPGRESYLIRNLGTAPLVINNVTVELNDPENYPAPIGGSIEFSFDADQELRDAQIESEDFLRLWISYDPQDDGVDQAKLIINSNDPDEPTFVVLLTSEARSANLEISPSPVVFTHESGNTDTQVVSFRNTGLRPLSAFLSVEPEDGPYRISPLDNTSFQVSAGNEQVIRLEYRAENMPADATLVVRSDDADNAVDGQFRVPLRTNMGSSLKLLEVDQLNLNFDGVAAGETMEATVVLSSTGDDPVDISAIEIMGSEVDAERFTVANSSSGSLAPGDTRMLTVSFSRPSDEVAPSAYQASLIVRSNSDGGDVQISLVANP